MNIRKILELILFSSKWLLIPFYFGLMFALGVFSYVDIKEILHMLHHVKTMDEQTAILVILKLIDLTMIANLVKMIIVGSYTSFFQKRDLNNQMHDPNLNTSSGVLKVKIATSIVGVASINLLQSFYVTNSITQETLNKQLIIYFAFIGGALALAVIDLIHVKAEQIHQEDAGQHSHGK